jgi:hypothetical protein
VTLDSCFLGREAAAIAVVVIAAAVVGAALGAKHFLIALHELGRMDDALAASVVARLVRGRHGTAPFGLRALQELQCARQACADFSRGPVRRRRSGGAKIRAKPAGASRSSLAPLLLQVTRMDFENVELDSPVERQKLTPREAEQLVEQRIEDFGLGALPAIAVTDERGYWRITWDGKVRLAAPMTQREWLAWLEQNVGEVDPEHLGSLEG